MPMYQIGHWIAYTPDQSKEEVCKAFENCTVTETTAHRKMVRTGGLNLTGSIASSHKTINIPHHTKQDQ